MFKKIVPWIVSALLCVLAVEALGAAVFFSQNRSLVYRNNVHVEERVVADSGNKLRLHPYFGYTGTYSLNGPVYTNNLGFGQAQKQTRNVPFKPEPNDFVVVILGASVAGNMVVPTNHGLTIDAALKELPLFKDKNVIVYCMSLGPQKQPQQLMELAFLIAIGQHIDLVLDVSGPGEFTLSLSNYESAINPIFPPAMILGAIGRELAMVDASSSEFYEMAFYLSHDQAAVKRYTKLVTESSSGLEYLKNKFAQAYYARRLVNALADYERAVAQSGDAEKIKKLLSLDMDMEGLANKDQVIDRAFQTWLRCLDLMKLMANANGAAFIEIVHPNLYYSNKKLTESEQAAASILPEGDYLRRGSSDGYRLMERHADMLKSRGIVSGADLFDNVHETMFTDSTGHFNQLGETLLTRFVASQVAARLADPSRSGNAKELTR